MKETLFGKTLSQLESVANQHGLPGYTAKQLADWLYKKDIQTIDEMSNLSKKTRSILEKSFVLGITPYQTVHTSADGTKKYLFPVHDGKFIESAYIPEKNRATLCVSSQIGCRMGCRFCMTGKQGFLGNLTAAEIVNQIKSLPELEYLSNIVYMGMGEPLDNFQNVMESLEILTSDWGFAMSPRRITMSTIGVIPAMEKFLNESECHLAISLHTPFDEERRMLMPVQNNHPIEQIIKSIRKFDFGKQRRISFEYIVFKDLNHTPQHINQLAKLLNGIRCRINLIRFHPIPGSEWVSPDYPVLNNFMEALNNKGIRTTLRASRGQDIEAACGLLSTKKMENLD